MTELIDNYLACWNETEPAARRALIEEHWSPELTYVDPMAQVYGREQLDATIDTVQQQFPGFLFAAAGPADAHHNQARFTWNLGPADAEPVIVGFDVVVTDADGRIRTVLGFLDRVPVS